MNVIITTESICTAVELCWKLGQFRRIYHQLDGMWLMLNYSESDQSYVEELKDEISLLIGIAAERQYR